MFYQKALEPSRRRQVVDYLHGSSRVSERRACRVARLNRGTFRYRGHKDPRTALRMRIREIVQTRVRYGYRKIRVLLNREGWKVGEILGRTPVYHRPHQDCCCLVNRPEWCNYRRIF